MNWTAFFLMLPHLKPKCLDILAPEFYRGLDALRVVSLVVIGILFLRSFLKDKKHPSLPSILLGAMEAWICLVTIVTKGDYIETCSLAVSVMAIVLLVDLYADYMKALLTALMLNYEWLVYVNFYTVWKYGADGFVQDPDYRNVAIYFFGPDNWFMYLCIPAICVALLYLRVQLGSKWGGAHVIRALCLVAVSYATIILSWPATAVVAMAVLAAVLVIGLIPGVRYCVSFPIVFIGGIATNLAITLYRVMANVPWMENIIENVLHKDTLLSNRTLFWDGFLEIIQKNLFLGIGNPVGGYTWADRVYDHIHNQYFDLLALGGVPALMFFLGALLLIGWMLTRHNQKISARIMTACMAGLLVMCIPEVCRHGSIFLLFPLAYHVQKIEDARLSANGLT